MIEVQTLQLPKGDEYFLVSESYEFDSIQRPDTKTTFVMDKEDTISANSVPGSSSTASTEEAHHKGHDNPGFEHSPGKDTPSITPSPPPAHEAVNLELVELTPPNKRMNEVDGRHKKAGLPDDHFIAVNEHKKGIRGEKLYVTKDQRGNENSATNRKRLCIGLILAVLLGAVIIAILVGAGVIDPYPDSQELKEKDIPQNGPRVGGVIDPDAGGDPNDIFGKPAATPPAKPDSSPNALEGELRLTNLSWDEQLADKDSDMYKELVAKLEQELKDSLAGSNSDLNINIVGLQQGSVIIQYRISAPNGGATSEIDPEGLKNKLSDIQRESRFSDLYEIDPESITLNYLQNECQTLDCSHACYYNYGANQFECSCPEGMTLGQNQRSCEENGTRKETDILPGQLFETTTTTSTNATTTHTEDLTTSFETIQEPESESEGINSTTEGSEVVGEAEAEAEAEGTYPTTEEYEPMAEGTLSTTNEAKPETEGTVYPVTGEPEIEVEVNQVTTEESEIQTGISHSVTDEPEAEGTSYSIAKDSEAVDAIGQTTTDEPVPEEVDLAGKHTTTEETLTVGKVEDEEAWPEIIIGADETTTTEPEILSSTTSSIIPNGDEAEESLEVVTGFPESEEGVSSIGTTAKHLEIVQTPTSKPVEEAMVLNLTLSSETDTTTQNVLEENDESATTPKNPTTIDIVMPVFGDGKNISQEMEDKVHHVVANVLSEMTWTTEEPELDETTSTQTIELLENSETILGRHATNMAETSTPLETDTLLGTTTMSMETESTTTDDATMVALERTLAAVVANVTTLFETTQQTMLEGETTETENNIDTQTTQTETLTTKQTYDHLHETGSMTEATILVTEENTRGTPSTESSLDSASSTTMDDTLMTSTTLSSMTTAPLQDTTTISGAMGMVVEDELKQSITEITNIIAEESTMTSSTVGASSTASNLTSTRNTEAIPRNLELNETDENRISEEEKLQLHKITDDLEGSGDLEEVDTFPDIEKVAVDTETIQETTTDASESTETPTDTSESIETMAVASGSVRTTTGASESVEAKTVAFESIETTTRVSGPVDSTTGESEPIDTTTRASEPIDTTTGASELELDITTEVSESIETTFADDSVETTTGSTVIAKGLDIVDSCDGQFKCEDESCIPRSDVCNNIKDCPNGSDEEACGSKTTCLDEEFACSSGRCLPKSMKCDGRRDCPNGEDELKCRQECPEDSFLCPEGFCISKSVTCDGTPDCSQGEDEKECSCGSDEFRCSFGGGCIMQSKQCDGVFDCADNSDEWNCLNLDQNNLLLVKGMNQTWSSICSYGWDDILSEGACLQMGFAEMTTASEVTNIPEQAPLSVNTTFLFESPLQGALVDDDEGNCSSVVALNCKSQDCGSWTIKESVLSSLKEGQTPESNSPWPNVAYIFNVKGKSSCTGSILSPKWLLISYSCIAQKDLDPLQWVAFGGPAGANEDSPDGLTDGTQIKMIEAIHKHPSSQFSQGFQSNDLALVQLLEPFNFTDGLVQSICMSDKPVEPEQTCVTAGWSDAEKGGLTFRQYMDYMPMPNYDLNKCNTTEHYNGLLGTDVLCTGTKSKDSGCRDDIGAPMMCNDSEGVWKLYGILNHEGVCRNVPHPDVYTSIPVHRSWIDQVMGRL
ncbi:uncharacterized protein LOC131883724 isoform X1 [Tigriopus californicus]|uniref:uncharacterized protein LOC131883724 isoform X1 n=1 Tax=Tigriopus californicus TaxID=6832 RepID=UPI0027DA01BD|nr:uncharacterized protein LOC131883724 isoform X1 [Tigriopus californicus]